MVSIPSSQIKNIIYIPPTKPNPKTTTQYNTKSVIREAENEGYFNVLTVKYLNERFNMQENSTDNTEDESVDQLRFIKAINLHHENIQKLTCLNYCRNIVYLNLSKNFIADFTALKLCNNLICLDLSSNLIQMLPDFTFWSQMANLKFLYLHDNPIADPDLVMGLFSCPNVIVLSLWDNPIALREKYRHYIVNSLWSLKILDKHFVSDEEIIEDADFCNSQFRSMGNKLKVDSYLSYGNENLKNVEKGLQMFFVEINRLESHLSPVLIMQKIIRGYLVRKRFGLIKLKSNITNMKLPPIQNSLELIQRMITEHESDLDDQTKYLKIDLIHLNKISTLENLDREANIRNLLSSFHTDTNRPLQKLDQAKCSAEYLSRALDTEKVPVDRFYQNDSEEKVSFRFKGGKPPTATKSLISDLQMEKKRSRFYIKEFDKMYHKKLMSQKPDIKSRTVQKHNRNQLYRKSQGCMGLFLLYKWDKTDRELQEIEKYHEKVNQVRIIKNDKVLNFLKIEEDRMRKLVDVRSQHVEHKANVEKCVEKEKENKILIGEEVKMKKIEASEKRSKIMNEIGFSMNFRSKQSAAGKAVNKFEQMTLQQDQMQINRNVIVQTRKKMKLEMETVKAYLENQSLSRRAENRLEESALDLQILHQTNNRLNDAKMRVERLKAIRRQVLCPQIPVIQLDM